jgi:hypothetical protein
MSQETVAWFVCGYMIPPSREPTKNAPFRRISVEPAKTILARFYSSVFGASVFPLTELIGQLEMAKRQSTGHAADASHHNVKMTFLLKSHVLERRSTSWGEGHGGVLGFQA